MSSKEQLKTSLKEKTRQIQEIGAENVKLKKQIEELNLRIWMQKTSCKMLHWHGQKFTTWIMNYWWRLYYFFKPLK